jgi:hypothetical protein
MNIFTFCLLLMAPMFTAIQLSKLGYVSPMGFACFLVFYTVIYHPTIVGLRLLSKGAIPKSDFAKTYIPFWNWKHYGAAFS